MINYITFVDGGNNDVCVEQLCKVPCRPALIHCVCEGMPPPSGVGIGSPMHPAGVDRKRPATDPRLAQQMKL